MLRVTSALSVVTWASLLVGLAWVLWQSGAFVYGLALAVCVLAIALSATMLVRNRPFLLGTMLSVSILGLLPGLWGVLLLFYCIGVTFGSSTPARPVEWFFAIILGLMLLPPINWAILWRDHRHDIALNI